MISCESRLTYSARRVASVVCVTLCVGLVPCTTHSQANPPSETSIRLHSPELLPGEYSRIHGLAEVTPNKLVITDDREKLIHVITLPSGVGTTVGREGRGPHEFGVPRRVYGMVNGSYVVADLGNRKLLVFDGNDSVVANHSYSEPVWASRLGGVDTLGRFYFESPATIDHRTGEPQDSAMLYRWHPATGEIIVLLSLDAPDWAVHTVTQTRGGARGTTRMLFTEPFSLSDEWAVLGGIRIGVWRGSQQILQLLDLDGEPLPRAAPMRFEPVRVTERDRRPTLGGIEIEWTYPEYKPIMVENSAKAAPTGHMWLQLHAPANADSARYAVFSPSGVLLGTASASDDERLVGLGVRSAYFARTDEFDLMTVVRYQVEYPSSSGSGGTSR